jgi:hypothetical protein
MALEGWLIEKFNTFTIEFRKVKPAKYKFNISLFYKHPFEYSNEEKIKNDQEKYEELGWTFVKKKKRSKKKNIVIFSLLLVITIAVSTSLTFGMIFKSITEDMDKEVEEVDLKGYKVLKLSDFGIDAHKIKNNLWKDSSIFVPVYCNYYEIANKKIIDTEYIKARNERICNYIYNEILKEKSSKSYYHITKGNPKKWEANEVHYFNDDYDHVMIKKENVIVIVEGDFDFSDTKVVEKCKKLLKE